MPEPAGETLSACLRASTALAHQRVERAIRLPESIRNLADYAVCLTRFYRIFAPLERHLASFQEWPALGIHFPAHVRAPALRADLAALGVPAPLSALAAAAPAGFPAALGALYVLEGSALGGKVILRALQARPGIALDGATAFFGGASPMPWPAFKAVLDAFGARVPEAWPEVLAGAKETFRVCEEEFEKAALLF